MKRTFLLTILCVITLAWGISHAGIAGSKHDLTQAGGGGGFSTFAGVQVCVFCHTPHGARTDVSATTFWNGTTWTNDSGSFLLWNRALPGQSPGDSSVTGFTLYTSPSFNSASGQLNVYTLMCMGCHDGVGALNVVKNYPSDIPTPGGPIDDIGNWPLVRDQIGDLWDGSGQGWGPNIGELTPPGGGDMHLENDHPVSIDYTIAGPPTGTDASAFNPLTTDPAGGAYVTNPAVRLFPDPSSPSIYRFIECSTCHDVHNNLPGQEPFLVMSNSGSALCTSCHKK